MGRTTAMLMAGALMVTLAGEAAAQSGPNRDYFATIGGGGQSGSTTFADQRTFTVYDEAGRFIIEGSVGSLAFFDIQVGRRISGPWTGSVAFHRGTKTGSGLLAVGVPHPLFFGRPRSRSDEVGGLKREEHATHIQLGYRWQATDEISVHVVAGPSFFRVKQALVTDVAFTEVGPPFTSINIQSTVNTRAKNVVGGHVGVDGSYRFYDADQFAIGAGAFLRYAAASASLQLLDNEVESNPGGFQYGLNLRFLF